MQAWIAAFGDRLAAVDIDGEPAYVCATTWRS